MKIKKLSVVFLCMVMMLCFGLVQAQNNDVNSSISDSNQTYLESLTLSEEGLTPFFTKYITDYALYVPENVTSLQIEAQPQTVGAKIEIKGNTNLKLGDNEVIIEVTSPGGNETKTYRIIVTRAANQEASNSYLAELIVDNYPLTPAFQAEKLEYTIGNIAKDIEELTIIPIAQNTNATVKVEGNVPLKQGQNNVIVTVTSPDKTTTKQYIIGYNKTENEIEPKPLVSEGGMNAGIQTNTNVEQNGFWNIKTILVLIAIIIIAVVVAIIIRRNMSKNK